jgi:hypothetical protein
MRIMYKDSIRNKVNYMKKYITTIALGLMFLVPSVSSAATFTTAQVNAIISLLQAFNVDAQTIDLVYNDLTATTTTGAILQLTSTSTPQVTIQPQATGGTITPTNQPILMPQDQSAVTVIQQSTPQLSHKDPVNGIPYGTLQFQVRVLDANGATVDKAPVTMSANGTTETRTIDTVLSPETKDDHYTQFQFTPQQIGTYIFTFTSGNLSKDIIVNVTE